jgi:hypothetical protein
MSNYSPSAISEDLRSALERFGVVFDGPVPSSPLYDLTGLWLDGKPHIGAWGLGCGRGLPYKDMGAITDGQKGAVRKISSGRKARGMASHDPTKPGIF